MKKIIKNIKTKLRGIHFYITFLKSCIPIRKYIRMLKGSNLSEAEQLSLFQERADRWMKEFWKKVGINVIIKGTENIPQDGRFVCIANHRSFLDIMIVSSQLPFPNKTIAKASGAKIPIMGEIWAYGSVLVDRKNVESKLKAKEEMTNLIDRNITPVFYPEGTRNTTYHSLLPFKSGAFEIAITKNLPILPIVIHDSDKRVINGIGLNPGDITVEILPIILGDNLTKLCRESYKNMQSKLINHNR